MKNLKYNWSMPNDVGVICNGRKQRRHENTNWIMKGVEMSWGEKKTTQKIPLIGANEGFNNK
jgi:hypothetical protein